EGQADREPEGDRAQRDGDGRSEPEQRADRDVRVGVEQEREHVGRDRDHPERPEQAVEGDRGSGRPEGLAGDEDAPHDHAGVGAERDERAGAGERPEQHQLVPELGWPKPGSIDDPWSWDGACDDGSSNDGSSEPSSPDEGASDPSSPDEDEPLFGSTLPWSLPVDPDSDPVDAGS